MSETDPTDPDGRTVNAIVELDVNNGIKMEIHKKAKSNPEPYSATNIMSNVPTVIYIHGYITENINLVREGKD